MCYNRILVVNKNIVEHRARLLPTYRWDDWDERTGTKVSTDEDKLRASTRALLLEYLRGQNGDTDELTHPPTEIIAPIVDMNIAKRSAATRQAEMLIEEGIINKPPVSLIPTFMASGHPIVGVEDGYMRADHPSQELFAYNRIGKKAWLNRRFGEHCLTAIGLAHPHGAVTPSYTPTRIKAHPTTPIYDHSRSSMNDDWRIISSKTPIALIHENGRRAALITRVTGAVDLTSPELSEDERAAVRNLSDDSAERQYECVTTLGDKALLLSALDRTEGTEENPFYPVIQTVYLTQLTS